MPRIVFAKPVALRCIIRLAVAGQVFVTLGALGWFNAWTAAVAVVLLVLFRAPLPAARRALFAAAAIAPFFLLALYPPHAFDETLYHLPFTEALARSGQIRFLADVRFPIFPQLHEALCAPLFLAFGDTSTHLVALAEMILLGALVYEWRGKLAAAITLGSPIVAYLATITYVDAALALFVAAGAYCLDREDDAWAGFLFGTACAVKYHGGYFALAGLAYLLFFRRRGIGRYLLALIAAAAPMYLTIVALTGNPLFPYFGATPWNSLTMARGVSLPTLLWDITFARDRVGLQPPYSPLFAIALIITFVAAFRDRRAAFVAAVCAGFLATMLFLPPDSRYLLPLVPLVSVVAATVFPLKRNVWAILAIAPAFLYCGYRLRMLGPLPLTPPAREHFLARQFRAYRALQHRGAGLTWLCGTEQIKYFGDSQVVGDNLGPYAAPPAGTRFIVADTVRCADVRRFASGFTRVYADGRGELWQLESPP
ncbi:MAG TPA: glycosyltransferase 87 family protein [Thermoanaerobaculia bacterium]|nr:glycosyltransferase 87 family protein [Thermoanaerobaculia bacterium]